MSAPEIIDPIGECYWHHRLLRDHPDTTCPVSIEFAEAEVSATKIEMLPLHRLFPNLEQEI